MKGISGEVTYSTLTISLGSNRVYSQSLRNASARLIFCAPKHRHITPLFQQLHWLPIHLGREFKILLIIFKVLQGSAP